MADGDGLLGLGPHAAEEGLSVGHGGLAGLVGGVGGLVEGEAEGGLGGGWGLGEAGQSGRGAGDVAEFLAGFERAGSGLQLSGALGFLVGGGQCGGGLLELGVEGVETFGQGGGLVGGLFGGRVDFGLEGGQVDGGFSVEGGDASLDGGEVDGGLGFEGGDAALEGVQIDGGFGFKLGEAALGGAEVGLEGWAGFDRAEAGVEKLHVGGGALLDGGEAGFEGGEDGCHDGWGDCCGGSGALLELVDAGLDGIELAAHGVHAADLEGGVAGEAGVLPEVDEGCGEDDEPDEIEHGQGVEPLLWRRRFDAGAVARRRGQRVGCRVGGDGDGVVVVHSCASTWSKVGANDTRTRFQGKGASRSAAGWPMAIACMAASAG